MPRISHRLSSRVSGLDLRRPRASDSDVRRPDDAALGDDAGDQRVRRHVERGIPDVRAVGRELRAADVRHLARVALLDRNLRAVRRRQIDRRERRGDVERNAVLARQHGHACRCRSCWRCRRWRRSDRRRRRRSSTLPCAHQRAGHVVGDDGRVDAVAHQFPRRQPRALQKRARLVGEHRHLLARLRPRRESRRAPCRTRPSPARRRCSASGCARRPARRRRRTRPSRGSSRRPRRGSRCASRSSRSLICSTDSPGLRGRARTSASSDRSPRTGSRPSAASPPSARRSCRTRPRTSGCPVALLCRMPSAMPMAAATPIAGAPRITIVLMARATSRRGLAANVDLLRRAACAGRSSRPRRASRAIVGSMGVIVPVQGSRAAARRTAAAAGPCSSVRAFARPSGWRG